MDVPTRSPALCLLRYRPLHILISHAIPSREIVRLFVTVLVLLHIFREGSLFCYFFGIRVTVVAKSVPTCIVLLLNML